MQLIFRKVIAYPVLYIPVLRSVTSHALHSAEPRMGNNASNSASISLPSESVKMVQEMVSQNSVVIFSKTSCPYCTMAKEAFNDINVSYKTVELDQQEHGNQIQEALLQITGARTVPRVFVNGTCIGGGTETRKLKEDGKLLELVQR
ncbi:glutaredoxin 2 [Ascaphus truei]|uniref:glutaredoxin 2 n=1 Tax=Ascaphus truei TaxID=8439 RepID=UPI003F5AC4C2